MAKKFVRTNSTYWDGLSDKSEYNDSIVFIEDTGEIWSNGQTYGVKPVENTFEEVPLAGVSTSSDPNEQLKYHTDLTFNPNESALKINDADSNYTYLKPTELRLENIGAADGGYINILPTSLYSAKNDGGMFYLDAGGIDVLPKIELVHEASTSYLDANGLVITDGDDSINLSDGNININGAYLITPGENNETIINRNVLPVATENDYGVVKLSNLASVDTKNTTGAEEKTGGNYTLYLTGASEQTANPVTNTTNNLKYVMSSSIGTLYTPNINTENARLVTITDSSGSTGSSGHILSNVSDSNEVRWIDPNTLVEGLEGSVKVDYESDTETLVFNTDYKYNTEYVEVTESNPLDLLTCYDESQNMWEIAGGIEPNKYYYFSSDYPIEDILLTLTEPTDNTILNIYTIEFTTHPDVSCVLSVPDTIKWAGGAFPVINPGVTYQLSIANNLATIQEFS